MSRPFELVPPNGTDQPMPMMIPPGAAMIPQVAQAAGMMIAVVAQQSMVIGQAMNFMMQQVAQQQRQIRALERGQGRQALAVPVQQPGMPAQIVVYRGELDVYGRPKLPPQPSDFCSPRSQVTEASPPPYRVEQGGFW